MTSYPPLCREYVVGKSGIILPSSWAGSTVTIPEIDERERVVPRSGRLRLPIAWAGRRVRVVLTGAPGEASTGKSEPMCPKCYDVRMLYEGMTAGKDVYRCPMCGRSKIV